MRVLAALDELPDVCDSRRAQQLSKLAELRLVTVRDRGDEERSLARAAAGPFAVSAESRRSGAPVAASLHPLMVAAGRDRLTVRVAA
jgi:hypothetical protein